MGANKEVLNDDGNLAVNDGVNGGKMINQWTTDEVVNWLNSCGFQDCVQVFQQHVISGPVLPRMTPDLLREMGVQSVGRRIQLQAHIVTIQAKARAQWRNEVLWAESQYRPGACNNMVPFGFPFCCECCTGVADIYKVTNSKVNILQSQQLVPLCGCCGWKVVSQNTSLTDIKDLSVNAQSSMAGDPLGYVVLNLDQGFPVTLELKSSQCQKVKAIIENAKEEAHVQEGLQKFGRA
jgi:hypothetical protein